jgi:hypothetical protein
MSISDIVADDLIARWVARHQAKAADFRSMCVHWGVFVCCITVLFVAAHCAPVVENRAVGTMQGYLPTSPLDCNTSNRVLHWSVHDHAVAKAPLKAVELMDIVVGVRDVVVTAVSITFGVAWVLTRL